MLHSSLAPLINHFLLHDAFLYELIYIDTAIFKRVQAIAANKGVRFVAINRRNYPGSTPYSPAELEVIDKGSEEQKNIWLDTRGHEIASFVVSFIEKEQIPPISGREGGVILLGWSVGVGEANATIATADSLPSDIRTTFTSYIRGLVLHGMFMHVLPYVPTQTLVLPHNRQPWTISEAGSIMMGLPMPEKNWNPSLDEYIPLELRLPAFIQWTTGYFKHGDLSTRDLNVVSYVLPSTHRVPTIFNIPEADQKEIIYDGVEVFVEYRIMLAFSAQLHKVYRKALFNPSTQKLFPHLKIGYLAGTETASFGIDNLWKVQRDAEEAGIDSITFKLEPGINHFVGYDFFLSRIFFFLKKLL